MTAGRRMRRPTAAAAALAVAALWLPAARGAANTPSYAWSLVAATTPPETMHPGQRTVVVVVARNDGSATWYTDDAALLAGAPPVRLAATPLGRSSAFSSNDPTWLWSQGTRIRLTTPVVPPGGSGAFAFTYTAPLPSSMPADYTETFAPVAEGVGLMAGPTLSFTTKVRLLSSNMPAIPNPTLPAPPCRTVEECTPPSPPDEYRWSPVATVPPPATMHPGQKTTVIVLARNDGARAWYTEEAAAAGERRTRLAAVPLGRASAFASDDPTWLWSGGTRIRLTTPIVEPGAVGAFAFTYTAPLPQTLPSDYAEEFAPIAEGAGLIPGPSVTFTTRVRLVSSNLPPLPNPGVPAPPCDTGDPAGCSPAPLPCDPAGDPAGCSPVPPPCDPLMPLSCIPDPPPLPEGSCTGSASTRHRDYLPPAAAALYAGSGTIVTASLSAPASVAVDGLGRIVVADTGNDRIVRMDAAGNVFGSWGGTGTGAGKFASPTGVGASPTTIYVADTGNDRIQAFSLGGTYLRQFGGSGTAPGKFAQPRGISVVASGPFTGSLAIADTGNDRIQIVSSNGEALSVIGTGTLSAPAAVSVYGNEIYVADTGNDRVVRFALDGTTTGVFGEAPGCLDAPGGVIASEQGVFVADSGSHRIRRFSRWGALLETWGAEGADDNQFRTPAGLAVDTAGSLWVAERGGNRLQRFRAAAAAAPPVPCGSDPPACVPGSSTSRPMPAVHRDEEDAHA